MDNFFIKQLKRHWVW